MAEGAGRGAGTGRWTTLWLQRMKKFAAMNKLKKAALLVIAKSLNSDEITGLQQLFRSIDVDDSGTNHGGRAAHPPCARSTPSSMCALPCVC